MTAIALKCIKVSQHHNADTLSVYKFTDGTNEYDIVANQENVYAVGDVAAVVLGGVLKDGTMIRPTNVRGVISLGMAMGKTNVDIGTDLSDLFLQPNNPNEHCFIPWTDIEQIYNVRKYIAEDKVPCKTISYRGKIKLDGTNAAIQILPNGSVKYQSRSRFITPENDQDGFARWAETKGKLWADAAKKLKQRITIFGEWCFYHDTPILLADGTKRKIGEIVNNKEKLEVLTYNFETRKLEPKQITGWSRRDLIDDKEWVTITVKRRHRGGKSTNLIVTKEHRIFCERNNEITEVPAGDLAAGDVLFVSGKMLSYYQKQFILGSLLGDGWFSETGIFACSHSETNQPWYSKFIENLLVDISSSHDAVSGHGSPMRVVSTKSYPEIRGVYEELIKDGVKSPSKMYLDKLHPPAFAAWYMDDGSLAGGHDNRQYQCDISTLGFTLRCNQEMCEWFCDHGFSCTVQQSANPSQYFLRLSPDGAEAFYRMIAPYVLQEFNYKLPPYLHSVPKIDWESRGDINGLIETTITQVVSGNKYTASYKRHGYDITVDGNHNYFANNVLVHNCGQGIQKRCSISQIGRKIFAVFAIMEGDHYIIDPGDIWDIVDTDDDLKIIGWHGDIINVDYSNKDQIQQAIDAINKMVEDVEACDPWVKTVFGVEGLGEGLVFYPMSNSDGRILKIEYDNYVFKAKSEKHQVVKNKKPAQLEPEKAENIEAFVKLFVTEPRLEQFATKIGIDQKKTGDFMKAFCGDVEKESSAELDASGMKWGDVAKAVGNEARKWYMEQIKKL